MAPAAGCDAVISAAFYGTQGGLALRNVGSFYDFTTERFGGTTRQTLHAPPTTGPAAVAGPGNSACDHSLILT